MKELFGEKNIETALEPELQVELENRLIQASEDNRIQCARALAIAKSLGIKPAEVGKAANRLKIKICKCQLGCF